MTGDLPRAADVTADSDVETVAKAAYYEARLSDSTHHGTNRQAAQDVLVTWAKSQEVGVVDSYCNAHDKFEEILEEKTA